MNGTTISIQIAPIALSLKLISLNSRRSIYKLQHVIKYLKILTQSAAKKTFAVQNLLKTVLKLLS